LLGLVETELLELLETDGLVDTVELLLDGLTTFELLLVEVLVVLLDGRVVLTEDLTVELFEELDAVPEGRVALTEDLTVELFEELDALPEGRVVFPEALTLEVP
jgi:hypothetical protein